MPSRAPLSSVIPPYAAEPPTRSTHSRCSSGGRGLSATRPMAVRLVPNGSAPRAQRPLSSRPTAGAALAPFAPGGQEGSAEGIPPQHSGSWFAFCGGWRPRAFVPRCPARLGDGGGAAGAGIRRGRWGVGGPGRAGAEAVRAVALPGGGRRSGGFGLRDAFCI